MDAIRTESLTKRFDTLTAVDGLTLSVGKGEIFGLVGPDGSGKTTTMRLLSAILEPTSGDAWVVGHHVAEEAEAIKSEIGYMSQGFGLYPDLSVLENIDFYADIFEVPRRGRAEKIERLLAFSNLAPFKERRAENLSGGMKQKLGLACALVHTPKVLLLDEPTNGVDPVSRRDFWRILDKLLREEVTIFVSTAYLDEAQRCNRVCLIRQGKILALDTPEQLKGLMRGQILEIHSSSPRRTAALLRKELRVPVGLFGEHIHLVTGDVPRSTAEVRSLASNSGVVVTEIHEIEPTLEDVFVSVIGTQAEYEA